LEIVRIISAQRDVAVALGEEDPSRMTGAGTNHTQISLTGGPAIVLVRPQLAVNIGMCARAMVNS
jgi:hypothetical protein